MGLLVAPLAPLVVAPLAPLARAQPGEGASAAQRLADVEADVARIGAEVDALAEQRVASERSMRERARALYRLRRAGVLPVAGGFDALLGHLARVERLERMVARDLDALRFLRQREEGLREELSGAERRIADARREAELAAAREAEQLRAASAFQSVFDVGSLPNLSVAPSASSPHFGAGTFRVHGEPTSSSFAGLRGQLPLPVRAGGAMREASREDGRGLEVLSPAGTPVLAVADGRVAFAQRYAGYGRMVILEHGDGHYTLYAGLGQSSLALGEWVSQGARVGELGGEPLYFEVRRGTRSLEARTWLGI